MPSPPSLPPESRRLLTLARTDRLAARAELARLSIDEQVALVCSTPVADRSRLIDLAPAPDKLVPELPEAELCYTAKAVGLHDAGWLMEHALPEQVVACVDLDVWPDFTPDCAAFGDWLRALAEAGEAPLLEAARHLDAELLVLMLRSRLEVELKPNDDSWEPPAGGRTLDGQFYTRALHEKDDLADIDLLLRVLFQEEYWTYFRLLQGVAWELSSETEEWALRWRTSRLMDLGFPTWDEAMAIYGALSSRALAALPEEDAFVDVGEWSLPIWLPDLPVASGASLSLFRAMAALPEGERRARLYALVALANKVAIADRLPLGDAESIPSALERAAELASQGLDYVSDTNGMDPTQVLRRLALDRLFRVGANLSGELGPKRPAQEDPAENDEPGE